MPPTTQGQPLEIQLLLPSFLASVSTVSMSVKRSSPTLPMAAAASSSQVFVYTVASAMLMVISHEWGWLNKRARVSSPYHSIVASR